MAGRLDGKVAFITGTAGGQGFAAAELFASEGAKVVGCDLNDDLGERSCRQIRKHGYDMAFRKVDLTDGDEVAGWLDFGMNTFGRCDILYNNASAFKTPLLEDMTYSDWAFTLRNELDVIFWSCKHAFSIMKDSDGGVILNTSSTAGLVGFPAAGDFAHAATKGGVIALTRQLAVEGAPHQIRANSISPGVIETPLTHEKLQNPSFRAQVESLQLLKRIGAPRDVAYCALYLSSDEALWVTGANFVVDGGRTAW